jgi:aconitate hydratase
VLAESYGPAHRSDLALMGVLPLEVKADLDGDEKISFSLDDVTPRGTITLRVNRDGRERNLEALVRLDSRLELDYFRHGGMLPYLLERIRHT